jgi:hypothetical protein
VAAKKAGANRKRARGVKISSLRSSSGQSRHHLRIGRSGVARFRVLDEKVLALANSIGLTGYDHDELLAGIASFWTDKGDRNRLVHDQWYPIGTVKTRGLTRAKTPQEIFGEPDVSEVWQLALRFQHYDGLFSHRAYMIRRERECEAR